MRKNKNYISIGIIIIAIICFAIYYFYTSSTNDVGSVATSTVTMSFDSPQIPTGPKATNTSVNSRPATENNQNHASPIQYMFDAKVSKLIQSVQTSSGERDVFEVTSNIQNPLGAPLGATVIITYLQEASSPRVGVGRYYYFTVLHDPETNQNVVTKAVVDSSPGGDQ